MANAARARAIELEDRLITASGSGSVTALTAWTGPDGHTIVASGGTDGTIRRWDAAAGTPIGAPLTGHTGKVTALTAWTDADGHTILASGDTDSEIRRWDATAGTPIGEPLSVDVFSAQALTTWLAPDGHTILASGYTDAAIRRWDATAGTPIGEPLIGHIGWASPRRFGRKFTPGWVEALTIETSPEGRTILVSGGTDGTIRRWDAAAGTPIGEPLTGHTGHIRWGARRRFGRKAETGSVHALTAWTGPDGHIIVASGGEDGTIRRWDATVGTPIGEPLTGHIGSVQALTAWTDPDGHTIVASGGTDSAIRRWDATVGTPIGAPLTDSNYGVWGLDAWTGLDGHTMLASIDRDIIRRWDATVGTPIGEPLTGHTGNVTALTAWTAPDGHTLLASAGDDGTIRVWDVTIGELLHRVFVEPIRLRGLADRPATRDLLGREAFTKVLANLLRWDPTAADGEPGPGVVAIEGPWGAGKTTVLRLTEAQIAVKPEIRNSDRRLSVAAARKILREASPADDSASITAAQNYRGALTAWFNPWVYQSSDEVWAGLARSIADAAKIVLYPTESATHRYWLSRNAERIDRFAVQRSLLLRVFSPLLGLSALTALATILINLAKLNTNTLFHVTHWRVTFSVLALTIAVVLLLIGLSHTVIRYYGRASRFLPSDLIRGPVLSGSLGEGTTDIVQSLRDPVYWAKSGYLNLIQKDTERTIRDLRRAGYDLVVFIDDLDRCSARTTAEVFEAINLFLSGTTDLNAKFVIGLDPAVVAAHLDTVYKDLDDAGLLQYGDDPSPGWAFLRKVVQLPVVAPRVADSAIQRFVGAALSVPAETVVDVVYPTGENSEAETGRAVTGSVQRPSAGNGRSLQIMQVSGRVQPRTGSLERQPEVLSLISERLAAQPERSAREAQRLLNVWQLYQRVLDLVAPQRDDEAAVARACHLVILAEIVTRWPALQRHLHQSWDGLRGLQILASACHDDAAWKDSLSTIGLDAEEHVRAVSNLRELLRDYNGVKVADLAAQIL